MNAFGLGDGGRVGGRSRRKRINDKQCHQATDHGLLELKKTRAFLLNRERATVCDSYGKRRRKVTCSKERRQPHQNDDIEKRKQEFQLESFT